MRMSSLRHREKLHREKAAAEHFGLNQQQRAIAEAFSTETVCFLGDGIQVAHAGRELRGWSGRASFRSNVSMVTLPSPKLTLDGYRALVLRLKRALG